MKMYIDGTPKGKNSGQIFRFSAPGAPTTGPDSGKEQKGISGYCLCQQRVTGALQTRSSEPPNSSATYLPATKNELAAWIPACRGNDGLKMNIDGIPTGKNTGRIFRLSALGASTTGPDSAKEQQGLSGHSLSPKRVSGAHQ
ncbi:hypothetical protein [Photobacterium salinisoli]|uniref:hypothetical protein n=1 Tax=Photobacterium salinisoli TaxID=1616783 RepID=UPI0013C4DA9E|nr:hypothetical protein [Photobacterium salinisoli]